MSKKIICLFLSAIMLFSCITPSFGATFTDVPKTNDYYEAIDLLSEFGIILGDAGAGTFRPEAEISREEFSVIVTRILGVSNIVPTMDVLPFTDVTPVSCADWAIIATKVAYDLGIISGYGDGRFGPKDPVTYEQVVKMLVCALGYGNAALEAGGWPTGYLTVANDLGITENAVMLHTGNAPRGIVAQLVYNCLDVDLMETIGIGRSEIKYGHTLLTDKLGYTYSESVVTGIPNLAYDMSGKVIYEDEVEIDGNLICNAGTTKIADYFGYKGEVYYKQKGARRTIVSFKPNEDNVVFELPTERIISVDQNNLKYYADEDESEIETMQITGAVYLYNGKTKDLSSITKPNIGSMKVIDNNDDEIADLVMVDDTRIIVVNSVDAPKKIITNKYDTSERLVLDGSVKDVEFLKDGKPSTFSSIVRDGVLMVTENDTKIIVDVITKTVNGTIESEQENATKIGIKGKTYELMPAYLAYIGQNPNEKMLLGDNVTVYVTSDNKILYGKINSVTTKAGYIIYAAPDHDDEVCKVRILNTSNKVEVKEFTEKVLIDGIPTKYDQVVGALTAAAVLTNKDENASNVSMNQLVKYTEKNGKIDAVYTMKKNGDSTRELAINHEYVPGKTYKYSSTTKKLGDANITLDSKTKVFRIPSDRNKVDDYRVSTGTSALSNNSSYKFEAYDVSDTGVAAYILVYGTSTTSSWATLSIVSSISTKVNTEGVTVNEVSLIANGKETKRETADLNVLSGVSVGDVIRYKTKNNVIEQVAKVYSPVSGNHKIIKEITGSGHEFEDYYYGYGSTKTGVDVLSTNVIVGTVYSRDDNKFVVSEGTVDANGVLDEQAKRHSFDFNDTIIYYMYDSSQQPSFITTDITREFMSTYLDAAGDASKVVIYNNSYTTVKFIYIIED